MKNYRPNTTLIILMSFAAVILIGMLLLMLPAATMPGEETTMLTALFTSATSVCVTGLVVVDTFSHWTLFGKVVIMCLIQIGGMGVIAIWAVVMLILQKRFSLRSRLLIRDYYGLDTTYGLIRFLRRVVRWTLTLEGIGAALYCFVLIPIYGIAGGIWRSVFTSVSAFCNAGIDLFGPDSLIPFRDNLAINLITMSLIILGGLGYIVWFDLVDTLRETLQKRYALLGLWRRLDEHTRLVLYLTLYLIAHGTVLVWLGEFRNPDTIGSLPLGRQLLASVFQSVTFRTAGFATIPQQALRPFTCLAGLYFMFIGGSPCGTAGGVKTVTAAVLYLNVQAFLSDRKETVLWGRKISRPLVTRATAIITVSLSLTLSLLMALLLTDNVSLVDAAYEIFSATGTVGLSRALTPSLSAAGKLIVIVAMFTGRIAPFSMALAFTNDDTSKNELRYPSGRFLIG